MENYKIKVTEENREAIKDIANRNGMNPNELSFGAFEYYYEIINGKINDWRFKSPINEELTFEQFKEMFDKETELDKWLKETKAKKLSYDELRAYINSYYSTPTELFKNLLLHYNCEGKDITAILFNQWNEPKEEWQPKRGDRVLVWDNVEEDANERIYLQKIEGSSEPFITVADYHSSNYLQNKIFDTFKYKNMKPLPTEQPTEPDFKSKVIELIESEIKKYHDLTLTAKNANDFTNANLYCAFKNEAAVILNLIKELN